MATTSEEEKKRTGQVDKGGAKAGDRTGDTTVRQQTPEKPRVPVLAYDLSDSPANTNADRQSAQARPNTGTNYVRAQSPQDRLNESYRNSQNRWEAEKARRAQFRATHGGRNEWQEREHQGYLDRIDARKKRIETFNDNVRGGNFDGMTRISDDNWSNMGEGSATAKDGWKMNDDGKTIALDKNGKPIRETSYTVEGRIDHNSKENVGNRAALEEWAKNQWRTNYNNGVAFSRYDGGFDTSRLPKGVFDRNGNLDLSKITSQKQMNALLQIMRQDQEATGAKGRRTNAEQAAAQVVKDLRASGLSDEQIAGMSNEQKTAARDQLKLNSAAKALASFYKVDTQLRQNPEAAEADLQVEAARRHLGLPTSEAERGRIPNRAQSRLDATLALREAGFSNEQIRKMIEGNDSSALRERLKAGQQPAAPQQPATVSQTAREIEAEVRGQAEADAVNSLPTVEQATPPPDETLDTGDLAAHRQATEGIDLNENPFADEDAAEAAAAQEFAAQQAANRQAQIEMDAENAIPVSVRNMGQTPYDPRAAWIAERDALFTRPDIAQSMADLAAGKEAARAAGHPSVEALTRDHVPLLSRGQYKSLMSDLPTPTEAAGRAYALNGNRVMAGVMGALRGAERVGAGFATGSAGARGLRTPTNAQQQRAIAEARRGYLAQGTSGGGVIELPAPAEIRTAQSGVRRARAQAKLDAEARGTQGEGVIIPPTLRQLQAQRKVLATQGARGEGVVVPPTARQAQALAAQAAAARGTRNEAPIEIPPARVQEARNRQRAAAQGTRGEGVVVPPAPPTQRQVRAKARQEDAAQGTRGSGVVTVPPTSAQARAAGYQGSHERNPARQQKRQAKIQRRAAARESREILESYRNRVERIEVPARRRAKERKRR